MMDDNQNILVQFWQRNTYFQCVELTELEGSVVNVAPS